MDNARKIVSKKQLAGFSVFSKGDGESEIDASSVVISVPPTHGQAEVADGKITYTPESDY
ncbi:Ig-like domain-containing protein [uncultured Alteromonas sp.]|uniref:Ig-like domain-containing protein n=1 Tax=uncultured Alteromonas sp. TaxID=179113 RepID=UPI0030D55BC9